MNMQTISLIAQKGGTGKTTLALSLAVAATRADRTVAVIDLDPQASAGNWADRRATKDTPAVVSAHVPRLQNVIDTARQNGVDLVIIDTPGKSEQAALAAAKVADLVLIPCRPQIYDIETLAATKEIVELSGGKPAFVVLNAVPPQGRRHEEAIAAIRDMGLAVCPVHLVQRAAFGDAPNAGQSASEYEPGGKAAQEIELVYKFATDLLKKFRTENPYGKNRPASRVA
jgi:chromosome partitioning protein